MSINFGRKYFALRIFLIVLVFLIFTSNSFAEPDYWPTKGWRTSTPEEQGMDSKLLADMIESIRDNRDPIHSITIIRNGYIVVDAYFPGAQPNTKHIIYSCTKSVTSALIGIAIDKGYIKSVNQSLLKFFPDRIIANLSKGKKRITLETLLTMTAGLRTKDSYKYGRIDLGKMLKSDDWVQYVLDLPMDDTPGWTFDYSNGGSFLLSAIIQNTTKISTLDFAKEYLFGPLGIKDVEWMTSPKGIYNGFGQMYLRPHDMAKIGFLYLNNGKWENNQIVSSSWVKASTTAHVEGDFGVGYGYQWWINDAYGYYALGLEGQYIFVIPEKNMVVVFTSKLDDWATVLPKVLLNTIIFEAAVSSKPLAKNLVQNARLDSLTAQKKRTKPGYIWDSEEEGVANEGKFIRTASPAFTFEYPKGSNRASLSSPLQIMRIITPDGTIFEASVTDIPKKIKLADVGPKKYKKRLKKVGSSVRVKSNEEFTLKDGTPAYRTVFSWKYKGYYPLTTITISSYKEGKWVFLAVVATKNVEKYAGIVESLTFDKHD